MEAAGDGIEEEEEAVEEEEIMVAAVDGFRMPVGRVVEAEAAAGGVTNAEVFFVIWDLQDEYQSRGDKRADIINFWKLKLEVKKRNHQFIH